MNYFVCAIRVIARPRMKGCALLRHIIQSFLHQFSPPVWRQCWSFLSCITVDESSLANKDMPCTHSHRLSRGCVSCVYVQNLVRIKKKNCATGTLKHGAFGFERGLPKREGSAAPRYIALARTLAIIYQTRR